MSYQCCSEFNEFGVCCGRNKFNLKVIRREYFLYNIPTLLLYYTEHVAQVKCTIFWFEYFRVKTCNFYYIWFFKTVHRYLVNLCTGNENYVILNVHFINTYIFYFFKFWFEYCIIACHVCTWYTFKGNFDKL